MLITYNDIARFFRNDANAAEEFLTHIGNVFEGFTDGVFKEMIEYSESVEQSVRKEQAENIYHLMLCIEPKDGETVEQALYRVLEKEMMQMPISLLLQFYFVYNYELELDTEVSIVMRDFKFSDLKLFVCDETWGWDEDFLKGLGITKVERVYALDASYVTNIASFETNYWCVSLYTILSFESNLSEEIIERNTEIFESTDMDFDSNDRYFPTNIKFSDRDISHLNFAFLGNVDGAAYKEGLDEVVEYLNSNHQI